MKTNILFAISIARIGVLIKAEICTQNFSTQQHETHCPQKSDFEGKKSHSSTEWYIVNHQAKKFESFKTQTRPQLVRWTDGQMNR